jgi:hypothetical protein
MERDTRRKIPREIISIITPPPHHLYYHHPLPTRIPSISIATRYNRGREEIETEHTKERGQCFGGSGGQEQERSGRGSKSYSGRW